MQTVLDDPDVIAWRHAGMEEAAVIMNYEVGLTAQ